jgi:hypothetical protein
MAGLFCFAAAARTSYFTSRMVRVGLCFSHSRPAQGPAHFKEPPMTSDHTESQWQTAFVDMVPEIQQRLRRAFRHLGADSREDAIEEGVVHSLLSYSRLHGQGRADQASPSTLAWYAVLQVKRGRPAGNRMNSKEPLSRYAQLGNGIQIDQTQSEWIDTLVEDKRATVADQVAAKLDVGAWFATLTRQMRQIAKDLAFGCSTSEVARKHGVTSGRISQLRRSLEESWSAFQQEAAPAVA